MRLCNIPGEVHIHRPLVSALICGCIDGESRVEGIRQLREGKGKP